jgi:hypothetical protein
MKHCSSWPSCACVCLFFLLVGWCATTHPKRRSSARPPAPCRSVHPVCMNAYLHVCLVSRSHSICTAAADMSTAAQSMLLLIHAHADTPPVRTPCPHVNHISVSRPHVCCLHRSPAVLRFAQSLRPPRQCVVFNPAQPCAPPIAPAPPIIRYVYPCLLH